jgi:glycosyltransferase involved in cell wall biosynthesis
MTVFSKEQKILHLGKFYPPSRGGIESLMEQTLLGLSEQGVDVAGLVFNESHPDTVNEIQDGIRLIRLGTNFDIAGSPVNWGLVGHLRRSCADIVHLHWPNPFALLAFLASGSRSKLVFAHHSDIIRQRALGLLFTPFLLAGLRRASSIIVTSGAMIEASRFLKPFRHKCVQIPYGINIPIPTAKQEVLSATIQRQYPGPIVLAVGRLVYYKGFHFLLEAMRQLDATLLIVGDGPLRRQLEERSSEDDIRGKVHLLGKVSDTRPYYMAANVFALPSVARSEGFGIVQLEAMAAGLPVVNTWLPSTVPHVSLHGRTGLTVPPKNALALAKALNTLLEDHELLRRLGDAGRDRFEKEFHASVMISRTLNHYRSI